MKYSLAAAAILRMDRLMRPAGCRLFAVTLGKADFSMVSRFSMPG